MNPDLLAPFRITKGIKVIIFITVPPLRPLKCSLMVQIGNGLLRRGLDISFYNPHLAIYIPCLPQAGAIPSPHLPLL